LYQPTLLANPERTRSISHFLTIKILCAVRAFKVAGYSALLPPSVGCLATQECRNRLRTGRPVIYVLPDVPHKTPCRIPSWRIRPPNRPCSKNFYLHRSIGNDYRYRQRVEVGIVGNPDPAVSITICIRPAFALRVIVAKLVRRTDPTTR